MNQEQKRYIVWSITVFLITAGLALWVRATRDLYTLNIFTHLFSRYDLSGAILSIIMLTAGIFLTVKISSLTVDKIIDKISANPITIAVVSLIILSLGALFVYHNHPLCWDESTPCFQAKVFAEGELWGRFPPELVQWLLHHKFFFKYSPETGRVVSGYWPGFALLLTPFMKIGVPWLLNPLFGASVLLLLGYYTKKILPNSEASGWVVLLTLASPAFTVNAISYYSMNAHLFMNLLYAVLLLECSPIRLFAAGVVGSIALVLHNPVPHILFAIPWVIWIALKPGKVRHIGYLVLGYLPLSLMLGFGWIWVKKIVTEGTLATSISSSSKEVTSDSGLITDTMAAIPKTWDMLQSETFPRIRSIFKFPSVELLSWRFWGLLKVFAWAVPGLPILTLFGIRYLKKNTHLKLWGWSALCTLTGYMFVPFSQGYGWGFRYFHSVWLILPLFAAAFLVSSIPNRNSWKQLVGIIAVLSLVFGTGLRCFQVHQFIDQHLAQVPVLEKGEKHLCFLNVQNGYYTQDLIQNDPFLRDPNIFFISHGFQQDKDLIQKYFPDAKFEANYSGNSVWTIE